jgi:nitronate monooxygenase
MAEERAIFPDFPTMYTYSEPLMDSSVDNDDEDFRFLLYGQAAALNRELPAAELVATLAAEAHKRLPSS